MTNFQALQDEPSANMQIQINDGRDENFPVKFMVVNSTALHDTGANVSCMSYACYIKVKDPPAF